MLQDIGLIDLKELGLGEDELSVEGQGITLLLG